MKLNEAQINELLAALMGWSRESDGLVCNLTFKNFKDAMDFVIRVADEAEAMNHHPDIFLHGWNKVRLQLMTHDVGGLTEKDFALATRINHLL